MPATNLSLRFSASVASKYHNCHGSANLPAAIPGFEYTPKEKAKARDQGTALHKVMEHSIRYGNSLKAVAEMLLLLADVWGKNRTLLLQDEKEYITWWFLKKLEGPVLEHKYLEPLLEQSNSPKQIRFLASALVYIAEILEENPDAEVFTEVKTKAAWLVTKPSTTIDVLIRAGNRIWIIDLKAGTTPIEVVGNEQLLYYAACFVKDETEINLVILQEDNIGEWTINRSYLEAWMKQMQESEFAILDGDLTLNIGSHCTFCPANPRSRGDKGYPFCPAQLEHLYGASDDAAEDISILEDE